LPHQDGFATSVFTAFRWRTSESNDLNPYSHHPYAYALSDPVLYGDPSGRFCIEIGSNLTFGTTCQHDPLLGSFNDTAIAQFAGGFVGRGLEAGRALGEPFTAEGRATIWRGVQAIRYAPQESWDVVAGHFRNQYDLAVLGGQSLWNHPICTLSLLSAADWGSIGFDVASTWTGARGIYRGAQARAAIDAEEIPRGARGPASGRPFNPDAAGGPIRNLYTASIRITQRGVDAVVKHLARFGPDEANTYMINRLRAIASGEIEPTASDLNFYSHELREYVRYRNLGWPEGQPADPEAARELWNDAHTATLEDYGLREGPGVLYHPEVDPYTP
jgi:hypothetical protein